MANLEQLSQSQSHHMLYNSINMKVQNREIYGDRVDECLLRAGAKGELVVIAKGYRFLSEVMKIF